LDYASATLSAPVEARHASPGDTRLAWEMDTAQSTGRHETWLLSFIDILALLLTLFVLLLAHQDRGAGSGAGEPGEPAPVVAAGNLFELLTVAPVTPPTGFAMPGNGLVPVPGGAQREAAGSGKASPLRAVAGRSPAAAPGATDTAPQAGTQPAVSSDAAAVSDTDPPAPPADAVPPAAPAAAAAGEIEPAAAVADRSDTQGVAPADAGEAGGDLLHRLQTGVLGERIEVSARPGAINLVIRDSILFSPASAALSNDGLQLLDQLAEILRTLPYSVSVEGHSDNVPIHTPQYPSNWELSAARASRVTRKLIEQGVARERLRAIGYGDTRPRNDNRTAENRARNRRVTFVLQVDRER
jgi:chemotaxis protein MotB